MTDIKRLPTLREANRARQAEWDTDGQIDLAYRGNELAGEAGEACNVIKKLERERRGIRGSRATAEHLAEELADVVICCDLIAMDAGIDLDAAVEAKFNSTSAKYNLTVRYERAADMLLALGAAKPPLPKDVEAMVKRLLYTGTPVRNAEGDKDRLAAADMLTAQAKRIAELEAKVQMFGDVNWDGEIVLTRERYDKYQAAEKRAEELERERDRWDRDTQHARQQQIAAEAEAATLRAEIVALEQKVENWRIQCQNEFNLANTLRAERDELRQGVADLYRERDQAWAERDEAVEAKDSAYEERNRVVAALASLFPSGICDTDIPGWDAEWHGCVYIDLPTGQASWHFHDSQRRLFEHLPPYEKEWDGHTTTEKYQRLVLLAHSKRDWLKHRSPQ
jgi:NTP pyrophosphatase (non-canonical NTP hydrolase)